MHYKIGEIVEGIITGIQPYGAFVSLDDETCGLIHISEISDGFVKDVSNFVNVGDKIKVKVIDYDEKNNQARLSIKALNPNRFRKERNLLKYGSLPKMDLGFKSLENKMEEWIKEAKKKKYD